MNLATQRFNEPNPACVIRNRATPDPVYSCMWYEYQIYDCWGAQHGCTPYQYIGDDGRHYQRIVYVDGTASDPEIVMHGPAPKTWIDNPDSYPLDPRGLIAP